MKCKYIIIDEETELQVVQLISVSVEIQTQAVLLSESLLLTTVLYTVLSNYFLQIFLYLYTNLLVYKNCFICCLV